MLIGISFGKMLVAAYDLLRLNAVTQRQIRLDIRRKLIAAAYYLPVGGTVFVVVVFFVYPVRRGNNRLSVKYDL